jgi:hypothetical protein
VRLGFNFLVLGKLIAKTAEAHAVVVWQALSPIQPLFALDTAEFLLSVNLDVIDFAA